MDFASGSGLVAIAARMAGASEVLAADIDPWTETAVRLNAGLNGVDLGFTGADLIGSAVDQDVLLAGDVFYDRDFAAVLVPWLERVAANGVTVLVGDPGRAYLPKDRLDACAVYEVPVTRALEDSEVKKTTVWRFR
jgi:predicted nicotinamide N-methyase